MRSSELARQRDVAHGLITKMRGRHPHLFDGEGARESWERMKARKRKSIADGLPTSLPPLHRAHRLQDRAAGVGFDWPDAQGARDKLLEELAEVEAARSESPQRIEEEIGDLLLAATSLARHLRVDPESALRRANIRFRAATSVPRVAASARFTTIPIG
jgi:uncharacterized protein YabN with tetrapyrrole methylase and pyrophosphatase domain